MAMQINEVNSLKDLRAFIRFPNELYRGNPYYVPALIPDEYNTLRRDKNPAFDFCEARYWLARRDGKVVGRVAAIINKRHASKWKEHYMRFGWLDFVDDSEVSAALMNCVESWARERDLEAVHGPLGFTDLDREGLLIEGFNEIGTMATNYNHPYYQAHLEALGYGKDVDWVEYEIDVPEQPNERIAELAEKVLLRYKLKLLKLKNKDEILPRAGQIFELFNHEYGQLYGVVPLTERQIKVYTDQYFGFVTPDYVPMVVDENDNLVAFGVALPSLSRALQKARGELLPFGFVHLLRALKKNTRGDLLLVAVKSEYRGCGVNAILIDQINQVCNRMGIRRVESNPELESNGAVQSQWKHFEKRQHKRRRCYIKKFPLP